VCGRLFPECCEGYTCSNFVEGECVLGEPGLLYTWGAPQSAGLDTSLDLLVPVDIQELVFNVSAGTNYTLVILSNRFAAVSGYIESLNAYEGHFGVETNVTTGVNTLQRILSVANVAGLTVSAPQFSQLFAGVEDVEGSGRMHSVFIDTNGNVYATGYNARGQLCLGDEESRTLPWQISLPPNERAVSAAVGREFTLILSSSGMLYGCGSNQFGQLGLGNDVLETSTPTVIDGNSLSGVKSISTGRDFSLVGTNDGIYVMGRNTYGQLCSDTGGILISTPTLLENSGSFTKFAAGSQSTYILRENGRVGACGLNDVGQLGDGSNSDSFGTRVSKDNIIDVFAGPSAKSAFFVGIDRKIYGTGLNDRGQLGVGDKNNRNVPVKVEFSDSMTIGDSVSASDSHTLSW